MGITKFIKNTGVKILDKIQTDGTSVKIVDKIQTDGTKSYIDEEKFKKKGLSLRKAFVNKIMDKYPIDDFLNLEDSSICHIPIVQQVYIHFCCR